MPLVWGLNGLFPLSWPYVGFSLFSSLAPTGYSLNQTNGCSTYAGLPKASGGRFFFLVRNEMEGNFTTQCSS